MSLAGKSILITGAARRVGREFALAVARQGAHVFIHYCHSQAEAEVTKLAAEAAGGRATLLKADLSEPQQAQDLVEAAFKDAPLFGLVNSAAIFEPLSWENTDLAGWERHIHLNLTAPFLLSQAFARLHGLRERGRIVNILDWRALRPGPDHLPYTISKAGLAALTQALALAFAPSITVNGLALGAILPPSDGAVNPHLLESVPAGRWAEMDELGQALIFLLDGPAYITGEIIHLDGGRGLV